MVDPILSNHTYLHNQRSHVMAVHDYLQVYDGLYQSQENFLLMGLSVKLATSNFAGRK